MAGLLTREASAAEEAATFMAFLDEWMTGLPSPSLRSCVEEAGGARHVGILCVDMVNGFCNTGPLHSERIAGIIPAIVNLFTLANDIGITHFILTSDSHTSHAGQFGAYPPHCLKGSDEAHTVQEIAHLPFAARFHYIPKNSINAAIGTALDDWLGSHPQVTQTIVVGNCTDICLYQLAMHIKCRADAEDRRRTVVVPMDCTETFDNSIETARAAGIYAHPASVLNAVFLYHMAMNGVRIVRTLT
jgi:nicotinamidase-related amidase